MLSQMSKLTCLLFLRPHIFELVVRWGAEVVDAQEIEAFFVRFEAFAEIFEVAAFLGRPAYFGQCRCARPYHVLYVGRGFHVFGPYIALYAQDVPAFVR